MATIEEFIGRDDEDRKDINAAQQTELQNIEMKIMQKFNEEAEVSYHNHIGMKRF